MIGCMILLAQTENSNIEKAHETITLKYENIKLPTLNKIKKKLHFLRFSNKGFN